MKTISVIFISFLFTVSCLGQPNMNDKASPPSKKLKGTIKVLSTPELIDVSTTWAKEFESLHPRLNIDVSLSASIKKDNTLPRGTNIRIGYVGDKSIQGKNVVPLILGREITVAVINPEDPHANQLNNQGVTQEQIGMLMDRRHNMTWGDLLGNNIDTPIHTILPDDHALGTSQALLMSKEYIDDQMAQSSQRSIINRVSSDPYTIGFCKMADILDRSGKAFTDRILLLPIDKNRNGMLDPFEEIYNDYEAFTRGVWIGKYPNELYRSIYSLSDKNQKKESVVAFLEWIVNTGQQNLVTLGYDDIVYNEKRANLNALFLTGISAQPPRNIYSGQKFLALVIGLFILVGLLINFTVQFLGSRRIGSPIPTLSGIPVFDINLVNIRKGLHFNKSHMWAFMNEDGEVKIGVDDFLHHATGPITQVKMKTSGESVKKGEKILTIIQKGKRLSIHSPVTGVIRECNSALEKGANLINHSPYTDGWVYLIEPTNWKKEIQELLMGNNYLSWLKEEFLRFKDFLASSLTPKSPYQPGLILQEGGVLKDGILMECGPEIWEEFQTIFIDKQ